MNDKPLVSICTPVYNGGEFLEGCIKGVLNQTYRNFEYIIVDNASTDNTPLIIEEYRKKDPRIRVYRNEKTVCMEDNFNLCANYTSSNAKWIKYALADDYLFPDCVEKMVNVGEVDDQIGIVSAYRMAGKTVTNMGLPIEQNVFDGSEILKQQILRKLHVASSSPNTVMYRKMVFSELKGFNNKYDHSDTELAFRILDKYKLGFVHDVLTKSGRDTGGGEYLSIKSGNKTREYLDFGYKNIKKYENVNGKTFSTGGAAYSISNKDEESTYLTDPSSELPVEIVKEVGKVLQAKFDFNVILYGGFDEGQMDEMLYDMRDTITHELNHMFEF